MITHTRICIARTPQLTITETHRRRSAVFARVMRGITNRSTLSDVHVSKLVWNTGHGILVSDLASRAGTLIAGNRPGWEQPIEVRDAWNSRYVAARHAGGELRVEITATIDGETVMTSLRCRAQAKRVNGDYHANNKLVLWYGRYDRRRGYGDETRVVEGTSGFDSFAISEAIVARLRAKVEDARRERIRAEEQRRAREARQQRMREQRAQREANRAAVDGIRREAELMNGLAGVTIGTNHDGTYSVSYTRRDAATTPDELRALLTQLASVLAPPPPAVPENDPDADDDFHWRTPSVVSESA